MRNKEDIEKWVNKNKQKVREYIERNNCYSVMNNTKWNELINAVRTELRFRLPYILKTLFEEFNENAQCFSHFKKDVNYLGAWDGESLCYEQYYLIEWIKIRPRYIKKLGGRLVSRTEVIDEEKEFVEILEKYNIPYEYDEGVYTVYGYKRN